MTWIYRRNESFQIKISVVRIRYFTHFRLHLVADQTSGLNLTLFFIQW